MTVLKSCKFYLEAESAETRCPEAGSTSKLQTATEYVKGEKIKPRTLHQVRSGHGFINLSLITVKQLVNILRFVVIVQLGLSLGKLGSPEPGSSSHGLTHRSLYVNRGPAHSCCCFPRKAHPLRKDCMPYVG